MSGFLSCRLTFSYLFFFYLFIEFSKGLAKYPRQREYESICDDTVSTLKAIPRKYGKCINDKTGKINPPCICKLIALTDNYIFYFVFKMRWRILLKSV